MSILKIDNLNIGFNFESGFKQALYDVSLSIEKGQMHALVGESGCGKSITAMSILNLLPKSAEIRSGKILFNNENILEYNKKELENLRGAKIALIPQDPMTSLNPLYTVGEQLLEVIRTHQGLSGDEAYKKGVEALEMVQIPSAKERFSSYPHEFSGGMKQRAIIAMALACNAEILIADEPTTALDVTIQAQIMNLLDEIKRHNNASILLITHDLALVGQNSDYVSVMYSGRIVEQAPTDVFFKNPTHPYSLALLNSIPSAKDKELSHIKGAPPSIHQQIQGCKFNPRCTNVFDKCKNEVPNLLEIEQNHFSACWCKK